MPPSSSRSPRRKGVRRYLSATGTRWSGRVPSTSKRRRSSFTSSGRFSPPRTPSNVSDDEEEFDEGIHLDDAASVVSHSETYTVLMESDRERPLAYASLPATPISSTPIPQTPPLPRLPAPNFFVEDEHVAPLPPKREEPPPREDTPPFSIWDYLREELLATDFDSHQELKWERVSNFLSMPLAIEKVRQCFCSLLYSPYSRIVDHAFWFHRLL